MTYEQTSGKLLDDNGKLIGIGWAGHLQGRNNPAMENVEGVGPLPRGKYVVGNPIDHTHLGPLSFPLQPDPSNKMFGRSGFFIHGASQIHPALSSDGCIIQGLIAREYLRIKIGESPMDSPLRILQVV
jgi:Protein of unknown function (DUF2778)